MRIARLDGKYFAPLLTNNDIKSDKLPDFVLPAKTFKTHVNFVMPREILGFCLKEKYDSELVTDLLECLVMLA